MLREEVSPRSKLLLIVKSALAAVPFGVNEPGSCLSIPGASPAAVKMEAGLQQPLLRLFPN